MDLSKLTKQELEKLAQDGMDMNAKLQNEIKILRDAKPPDPPVIKSGQFIPAPGVGKLPEVDIDFVVNSEIRMIDQMTRESLSQSLIEIVQVLKKYKIYSLKVDLIRKF